MVSVDLWEVEGVLCSRARAHATSSESCVWVWRRD